ncbi:hypothetical protein HK102_010520, partial [Quaeritorhiza haematococci]
MSAPAVNYKLVREDILALLKEKNCHPIFIRLAWHDAGTFSKVDKTGGPIATMRHAPVQNWAANNGLGIARDLLEPIKQKHPSITYADLWALAGVVSFDYATKGKLRIPFRAGRKDCAAEQCPPDGRLPDATKGSDHLRDIFYRMGLTDQDIVALSGAHSLG